MIDLRSTLTEMMGRGAVDIFIEPGLPLTFRTVEGQGILNDIRLQPQDAKELIDGLYLLADGRAEEDLILKGEDLFSFSIENGLRFRVSAYRQKGCFSAVLRAISFPLPEPEALGMTEEVLNLASLEDGMIIAAGKPGSGRTTTLACLIKRINESRTAHVVTLEDPIEYVHDHGKSIISQREIHEDTDSFESGLKAALRQNADVIMLSDLSGAETTALALKAAEGGRLVLASVDTADPFDVCAHLISEFAPDQAERISKRLSHCLKAVVIRENSTEPVVRVIGADDIFSHENACHEEGEML